ncbi:ATP-binding protein [Aquibium sp. LZ166]|uniref:histidine kinase n=1 Tax=Aquibium pacificus TaxID=3153579 RepID=A0ABV3SP59_9HYPH
MTDPISEDLEACAREPIHIPGAIQPHGVLLVLDRSDLTILQASRNAASMLGASIEAGARLADILPDIAREISDEMSLEESGFQQQFDIGGRPMNAAAHRSGETLLLELETVPVDGERSVERLFPRLRRFADSLAAARDDQGAAELLARHIRGLTGFDRVLVYRFDEEWNGHVIGEDGNGVLPSYLGLRFPAGDIPAQARQLYRLNRVRIIPDVNYVPVSIDPDEDPRTGQPLDLSFSILRSVSPIHLEYMRNMGTAASMSVSIVVDGKLWGLVACHSRNPHMVALNVRDACDFAVQSAAMQIAGRERAREVAKQVQLGETSRRLLAAMTYVSDWRKGIFAQEQDLLAQVGASGAAIVAEDGCWCAGKCPGEAQIRSIVDWLERKGTPDIVSTDHLAEEFPDAAEFADVGSGLIAITISELYPSWLLWFRPEVVRTVAWGGDPHKVVREAGRIHPRKSFEAWKEQLRHRSTPWSQTEIAAARNLRDAVVGIVLRRAEELAQLTEDLQRSNKELEAFSYSVSHDLRAPFRHIVGFSELLREREKNLDQKSRHYLDTIAESAVAAGRLVDDLLNFSHLGRTELAFKNVDMNKVVNEVRQSLALAAKGRRIVWNVEELPSAWGDATLLRQVWHNLVENAVKYTRPKEEAVISISGRREGEETIYAIGDNGVGFDMAYIDKLFGVFQRLQRVEDFEGTGIGLALSRRVIERHGGRIWAEGEVDRGARFHFALPVKKKGEYGG